MVKFKDERKVVLKHIYWRCALSTGTTVYEVMYPEKYVKRKDVKYARFETLKEALKERDRIYEEMDNIDAKDGVYSEDFRKIRAYTDKRNELRNLCLLRDGAKLNYYKAIQGGKTEDIYLKECYRKAIDDYLTCECEAEVMKQHLGSYYKKNNLKSVGRAIYVYINADLEINHYEVIPTLRYKKLIKSHKNYRFKSLEAALDFRNLTDNVVDVHMMEQFRLWYKDKYPDKSLPYGEHILKEMKKF